MSVESVFSTGSLALYGAAVLLAVLRFAAPRRIGETAVVVPAAAGLLALAGTLVARAAATGRFPAFGRFEALTWYAAAVTVAYVVMALRHRLPGVSAVALIYVFAVLLAALPGQDHPTPKLPERTGSWLVVHVLTSFAGYGFFTLSGVLAVAYLVQDHNLKRKRLGALFQRLPALETLDHLMYGQISFAFLLFTVSILFGVLLTHLNRWGPRWVTDPKIAASAATWIVYAILFHLRINADRHGKRVAVVTIAGLLFVLFTFVGVHTLATSMHDFAIQPAPGVTP